MRVSSKVILIAFVAGILSSHESAAHGILRCVAFSPYVRGLDPRGGPHPQRALIDRLLDRLIQQTDYRCIQVYGLLHGLDYVASAAQTRGLTVYQIIWLDSNPDENDRSIDLGIEVALNYPTTVARLSCGSEVRTRNGTSLDPEIRECIERLRAADVTQPITAIDTWWQWCNRSWPCQPTDLAADVDWIGINVHPWWENRFSGLFPCTSATEAPQFHIARVQNVMDTYPGKEVILTEFGWPAGPSGRREVNQYTGEKCGVASKRNQDFVIRETLRAFDGQGWQAVAFEAFQQPWKTDLEGPIGGQWGRCRSVRPYTCSANARFSF